MSAGPKPGIFRRSQRLYQRRVISDWSVRLSTIYGLRDQLRGWFAGTHSMVELAVVVTGLFSAGIFLAHAVEAYHAR